MSDILRYSETLEFVERFMEKSGIRSLCTDFCKGVCCRTLRVRCTANCDDRKLSCGIYLCNNITMTIFNEDMHKRYYKMRAMIIRELSELSEGSCIYSTPVSKEIKDAFELPRRKFLKLYPSDSEMKEISRKVCGVSSLFTMIQHDYSQKRIKHSPKVKSLEVVK